MYIPRAPRRKPAENTPKRSRNDGAPIIGVGIDCGEINFGEFGRTHNDLTAIGTVVNRAARAQAASAPDQILVTRAVRERARAEINESSARDYAFKGFNGLTALWAA